MINMQQDGFTFKMSKEVAKRLKTFKQSKFYLVDANNNVVEINPIDIEPVNVATNTPGSIAYKNNFSLSFKRTYD